MPGKKKGSKVQQKGRTDLMSLVSSHLDWADNGGIDGAKLCTLKPAFSKKCNEFVVKVEGELRSKQLPPNLYFLALCSLWMRRYHLSMDAYATHVATHANLEAVLDHFNQMEHYSGILYSKLEQLILNPAPNEITSESKIKIMTWLYSYLSTYIESPANVANAYLIQSGNHGALAMEYFKESKRRYDAIKKMGEVLVTHKKSQARATRLGSIRDLYAFMITTIDQIQWGESKSETFDIVLEGSCSSSIQGSMPVQILDQLDKLPATSSATVSELVLTSSLDAKIIKQEMVEMIRYIDKNETISPEDEQIIQVWLTNPTRRASLLEYLEDYCQDVLPDAQNKKNNLTSGKVRSEEQFRRIIGEFYRVIRLNAYFFALIRASSNQAKDPMLLSLAASIWFYYTGSASALHTRIDTLSMSLGQMDWYFSKQKEYNKIFLQIYESLFHIMLSVICRLPIQGMKPEKIQFYRNNMYGYFCLVVQYLSASLNAAFYCGKIDEAKHIIGLCEQICRLMKQNSTLINESHPKSTGKSLPVEDINDRVRDSLSNLSSIKKLLNTPDDLYFNVTKSLYELIPLLDQFLANVIDNSDKCQGMRVNAPLKKMKQILHIWFEEGEPLDKAMMAFYNQFPKLLHELSACKEEFYWLNLNELSELIKICIDRIKKDRIDSPGLIPIFRLYQERTLQAIKEFYSRLKQTITPQINEFMRLLEDDAVRMRLFEEARSINYFQQNSNKSMFSLCLINYIRESQQTLNIYKLGALVFMLDDSKLLIKQLFDFVKMLKDQTSFEEAQLVYRVWNANLERFIAFINYQHSISQPVEHLYNDLFMLKISEVGRYLANARLEEARNKLIQTFNAFECLKTYVSKKQADSIDSGLNLLAEQLDAPYSLPKLVYFLAHSPSVVSDVQEDSILPEPDESAWGEVMFERFIKAWFWLERHGHDSSCAQKASELYTRWGQYFTDYAVHADTRALLQNQWKEHYIKYVKTPEKPKQVKRVPCQLEVSQREKTPVDWKEKQQNARLEKVLQYNAQRPKQLERIRLKKKTKQQPVVVKPESIQVSVSEQSRAPVVIQQSTKPKKMSAITPKNSEPVVSDTHETTKKIKNSASYAHALMGLSSKAMDFPPLPSKLCSTKKKVPLTPVCSSSSSFEQNNPLHLSFNFQLPQRIQDLMKKLDEEEYEVYLVGGAVRDQLRKQLHRELRKIEDFDIFTNCPPDKINEFFPKSLQISHASGLFVIPVPEREVPIQIQCMTFKNATELAEQLDSTVNAFMVNVRGEVVMPLERSLVDLQKRQIVSITSLNSTSKDQAPVRMWRFIRQKNEFSWNMPDFVQEEITLNARLIGQMSVGQFEVNFRKCFAKDKTCALNNIDDFYRLGLLGHLFVNKQEADPIDQGRLAFCKEQMEQLFDQQDNLHFVNILTLFVLMVKKPSIECYKEQINAWIDGFTAYDHYPGVLQSLRENITNRLEHYHRQLSQPMNPTASEFSPPLELLSGMSQSLPWYLNNGLVHSPMLLTQSINPTATYYSSP